MAIYFPNTQIQEVGSGVISIPGTVIQCVESVITGTLATTTEQVWLPLSSGTVSITPTNVNNKIYIYYNSCFRKDNTQGNWSLGIIGLYHNTSSSLLSHSGWNGGWRHAIGSFRKMYVHSPNSIATQTYSLQFYNHSTGVATTFYGNSGCSHDGKSFIRLMEIAA